jgi:hypothetical protein
VCLLSVHCLADTTPLPNSDPTYQQLRNITLGREAMTVSNLTLRRDAATFHLRSGIVCFLAPVQGKITGAVFSGDGNLILDPPIRVENGMLKLLTKEDEFVENFSQLVLRFTDSTYDEIKHSGGPASSSCDAASLQESQKATRKKLFYNLDARILQDVLSPAPGSLFVAFIHGRRYNDKELFAIDPHGAPQLIMPIAPEEEELVTYDDNKWGVWTAFHLSNEYKTGAAAGSQKNGAIQIEHQQLDTTIEKNANLTGKAVTTFTVKSNGVRVVPLNLFASLRVSSVTGDAGQALSFIQEDKKEDADFSVILHKPLDAGEQYSITTTYGGKDAVHDEGGGNYFPVARENWYPNQAGSALGNYSSYDMTFRIPKGMKIAVTGTLVSNNNDGGQNVTVWKTEVPQTVAGFNFGKFKMQELKLEKPPYLVQSYANEEPPAWVESLRHIAQNDLPIRDGPRSSQAALGTMSTVPLLKKALAEGELSIELYSDFFGPAPYGHLAITQQTACNYGQSWPGLVWIPLCYYFDTTVRHQLGMDWGDRGYWKIVTPHEVAHQWWGHTVGFNSYRDQWMSEGFADMSASLYTQMIEKNPQKFINFWNDERDLLLERNPEGFRAIDAGPVTMGYRLSNSRTGGALTRRLIYPKGAYILHMVRMMMWDRRTGDQNFKDTMHDFVRTYSGRAATTEDFKAMVEKHMTSDMDLEGNRRMDWFFNQYVYGTALPSYKFESSFASGADGNIVFSFKLTQSNVTDNFRMLVPIYVELADGRTLFLGRGKLNGDNSVEQTVPLNGVKDKPHRALINYYDDVLASPN